MESNEFLSVLSKYKNAFRDVFAKYMKWSLYQYFPDFKPIDQNELFFDTSFGVKRFWALMYLENKDLFEKVFFIKRFAGSDIKNGEIPDRYIFEYTKITPAQFEILLKLYLHTLLPYWKNIPNTVARVDKMIYEDKNWDLLLENNA